MRTLSNFGKEVLVYTLTGIMAVTTAFSAFGCGKEVNINEEVNNVNKVEETNIYYAEGVLVHNKNSVPIV